MTSRAKLESVFQGPACQAASDAVFHITELLEYILSHLDIKDILRAQRISKKWQAVVVENGELQQRLFLAPEEQRGRWKYTFLRGYTNFSRAKPNAPLGNETCYDHIFDLGRLNYLLLRKYHREKSIEYRAGQRGEVVIFRKPKMMFESRRKALLKGSCHNMFLTQPPVHRA